MDEDFDRHSGDEFVVLEEDYSTLHDPRVFAVIALLTDASSKRDVAVA